MVKMTNVVQGHGFLSTLSQSMSQLERLAKVIQRLPVIATGHMNSADVIEGVGYPRLFVQLSIKCQYFSEVIEGFWQLARTKIKQRDVTKRSCESHSVCCCPTERKRLLVGLDGLLLQAE